MFDVIIKYRDGSQEKLLVQQHNYVGGWLVVVFADDETTAIPADRIEGVAAAPHEVLMTVVPS